jgi:phospholipid transport system substrate-binding protein
MPLTKRRAPSVATLRSIAVFALAIVASVSLAHHARSQGADPIVGRIELLHGELLDTMKQAKELGVKGRYERLAPVLATTYDIASMSRIAVGQSWASLAPEQQAAIVDAFTRMMVATYASRFNGFSGETFEVVQILDQAPADKMIKTRIVQSNGKAVALNYLMRKSGSEWKIVDVYLDGTISELASRRAEFNSILKSGGPDALIATLKSQGDKLLGGA